MELSIIYKHSKDVIVQAKDVEDMLEYHYVMYTNIIGYSCKCGVVIPINVNT
jgi:hypothetical protein